MAIRFTRPYPMAGPDGSGSTATGAPAGATDTDEDDDTPTGSGVVATQSQQTGRAAGTQAESNTAVPLPTTLEQALTEIARLSGEITCLRSENARRRV